MTELRVEKFHEIFYELFVALKATLPLTAEIKSAPEMTFGSLIEVNKDKNVKRACMPAVVTGNEKNGGKLLEFKQWFDPTPVAFYQLCFQLKPTSKKPLQFRDILFGRASERQPFGFRPASPYINLQFLSRTNSFEPLFCRIRTDEGQVEYHLIQAGLSDNGDAYIVINQTEPEKVPDHLKNAVL